MPELYGSPYILPGVIVVVLLLLLVLFARVRRRRRLIASVAAHRVERPAAAPVGPTLNKGPKPGPETSPGEARQTSPGTVPLPAGKEAAAPTTAAAAAFGPALATAAATASSPIRAPQAPAAATPIGPSVTPVSHEDPLRAVVTDLLEGWGDLTNEDAKRLEVFRPEKILETTETIVLPKGHKAGEHAHARLLRIREIAEELQLKAATPSEAASVGKVEPAAPSEVTGLGKVEPAAPSEVTGLGDAAVRSEAAKVAPGGIAPIAPSAGAGSPPLAPRAASVSAASVAAGAAADPAAAPPVQAAASVPVEPLTSSKPVAPPEPSVPGVPSTPDLVWDEATPIAPPTDPWTPSLGVAGANGWQIGEPKPPEAIAAPPHEQVPAPTSPIEESLGPSPIEESLGPRTSETRIDGTQRPGEDTLSGLRPKIKTAADLFALPAGRRADMLVFLEPAQLSKVFEAADDTSLKKGVIDTLEHVGNPSALGVLRRCLEDSDPQVQMYALEAADRLLGAEET